MDTVIAAPIELIEAVGNLRFPPRTDAHLQNLMDRNTNGLLTPPEREDQPALAELSETIALLRARALHVLGRKPEWPHGMSQAIKGQVSPPT